MPAGRCQEVTYSPRGGKKFRCNQTGELATSAKRHRWALLRKKYPRQVARSFSIKGYEAYIK